MTRDRYSPDFATVGLKLKEKKSFQFVHYKMYFKQLQCLEEPSPCQRFMEKFDFWHQRELSWESPHEEETGDVTETCQIVGQWLSRSSECQADLEIIANQSWDCHQCTASSNMWRPVSLSVSVTQSVRQSIRLIKLLIKIGKTSYSNGQDTSIESCFVTDNS